MNPWNSAPVKTPVDPDLLVQANPGHGVPSQDPDPAAQTPISPQSSTAERKTVYMGGGVLAGAVVGAAIGAAIAGPVGIVIGGTLGSVAGAFAGAMVVFPAR